MFKCTVSRYVGINSSSTDQYLVVTSKPKPTGINQPKISKAALWRGWNVANNILSTNQSYKETLANDASNKN